METIKGIVIAGLCTDDGHHKQWYLEQILIRLGFDLEVLNPD